MVVNGRKHVWGRHLRFCRNSLSILHHARTGPHCGGTYLFHVKAVIMAQQIGTRKRALARMESILNCLSLTFKTQCIIMVEVLPGVLPTITRTCSLTARRSLPPAFGPQPLQYILITKQLFLVYVYHLFGASETSNT